MITLEERRKIAQISLVLKLINSDITSKFNSNFLEYNELKHFTRNKSFFKLQIRKNAYTLYELINYMLSTFNEIYCKQSDISNEKLIEFEVKVSTVKH